MRKKKLLTGLLCAWMIAGCAIPMITAEAAETGELQELLGGGNIGRSTSGVCDYGKDGIVRGPYV